ncbi:MAG: MaoC family dehydratase [Actinomycetota bacterium]|nr:MaoC family dehydratase [Actinomycetota bacterium]
MSKEWRGRFFEDFEVGDVYRSWLGRTVTEADNVWFTTLTMNTNQMHFNREWAERTEFGRPLVNSTFTLALVLGLAVRDTSENAAANLGWSDIKLPKPVFAGDTLWAESEVLSVRASGSRPSCGIVSIRTRGVNQRREVVIEFSRTFMVFRRDAPEVAGAFPVTGDEWTV